jgi:hypothetical protein
MVLKSKTRHNRPDAAFAVESHMMGCEIIKCVRNRPYCQVDERAVAVDIRSSTQYEYKHSTNYLLKRE